MLSNFLICYMHNLMPSLLAGERRLLGMGKGDLLEEKVTIWYCYFLYAMVTVTQLYT